MNLRPYIGIIVIAMLLLAIYLTSDKVENTWLSDTDYTFGIDVSHYQGRIDWGDVKESHHPIQFVFIRSTMGHDGKDTQFNRNWKEAKQKGFVRGAYHYYRPDENSVMQFENFKSVVDLNEGDFPPILDIEEMSPHGADNLRKGVKNWLKLAEEHYGIRPMVYTGRNFYHVHLKGHVDDCPLWIAAYSGKSRLRGIDWHFHQFTEEVRIDGIDHLTDGNDFKGTIEELKAMCITRDRTSR